MQRALSWLCLLAALILVGCATPQNAYVPPTGDPSTLAVIKPSSVRNGAWDWESYLIRSIDNQPVTYNCFGNCQWTVTPGEHVIVVDVQFVRSLSGGGPYKSLAAVPVVVKAGKVYIPTGREQHDQFGFEFVEETTRERAGGPVFRAMGIGSTQTYIPMVVPKK